MLCQDGGVSWTQHRAAGDKIHWRHQGKQTCGLRCGLEEVAKRSAFRGWFGTVGLELQENIMPDWSIKIEGKPPAKFTPDIDGVTPGTPLTVVQGDLVSWNNQSGDPHFPVPDEPAKYGAFMRSAITPGDASDAYNVVAASGAIISYHCSLHDNEHGQILVVDFGASDTGTEDLIA
jgi:hypothetical protein